MNRDLRALADREFDLLVVGAGIYGATLAWEATQRGLSVAVIDRGDFGSGTSFNSLKTIHGGLRSLQRAKLTEMRRFIAERRALMRIAPHLVRPLRFLIPTRGSFTRSRAAMRLALMVNDLVGRDRNSGLDRSLHLPDSALVSRADTLRLFAGLDPARISGGASWYDGQLHHADRVLLAFIQSAVGGGAVAANYVSARALLRAGDRAVGMTAHDELTGTPLEIRARQIVNASGGWAASLTAQATGLPAWHVPLSRAVNLVTRLPAPPCALGETANGQFLFQVPWRGISMFGTLHDSHAASADDLTVRVDEVHRFIQLINRAFPAVHLTNDDVTLVHRGLLPAAGTGGRGDVRLAKESLLRDHRADGVPGLMTLVGVRYTTARWTAEQTIDAVGVALNRSLASSRTATTPLVGGDIPDLSVFVQQATTMGQSVDRDVVQRLVTTYGTEYHQVLELMRSDGSLAAPLGSDSPITGAEVNYSVRVEMAQRLVDVVMRRTDLGSAACPARSVLERAASLMAQECGWNQSRVAAEIDAVEARYRIPS